MTRVSATEFKKKFGEYSDAAMTRPVFITSHQRDRLVVLSVDEYNRLKNGGGPDATASDEERIRKGMERHRGTIVELANR